MKMSDLDLKMVVSWKKRIKIAEDIAIALAYLHTAFPRPFVYRAMCTQNIFLDEDGVARLWDFSCCVSIPKGETFVQVDTIAGSYGFLEDEYLRTHRVSEKTDVFAIGILMQTLLTGKESFDELGKEHWEETTKEDDGDSEIILSEMNVSKGIVTRWMSKSVEELADPKMLEKMDEIGEVELCQMKDFIMLSMRCIGLKGEVPNMVEVAKELKKIQRYMKNASSLSPIPSGETKIGSSQDISSLVLIIYA